VVARLDVGHALADRLDDARALVSEDDGEGALGILAREGVGICSIGIALVPDSTERYTHTPGRWAKRAIKVPGAR
jgi:hypothetical protein